MYKVIATDLDGTLLDGSHQLDPLTRATIRTLASDGMHFVLATGRHYRDAARIRDFLGIHPHLITSNGARVHAPDDTMIYAQDLSTRLVRRLVQPEISGTHGRVIVNLFADNKWLIDRDAPELLAAGEDSGFRYEVIDTLAHDGNNIAKILYIGSPDDLAQVQLNLQREFGATIYATHSLPNCLEVMAPNVSKGRALQFVLDRLGTDASDCIAFGDNMNDFDLLATAGHPFMMSNASPCLIASLPQVPRIGNNTEAGVAHQLRKLFSMKDEYVL
jgi:Cof subfamily protein (haloacid dehalogenase superfamily)